MTVLEKKDMVLPDSGNFRSWRWQRWPKSNTTQAKLLVTDEQPHPSQQIVDRRCIDGCLSLRSKEATDGPYGPSTDPLRRYGPPSTHSPSTHRHIEDTRPSGINPVNATPQTSPAGHRGSHVTQKKEVYRKVVASLRRGHPLPRFRSGSAITRQVNNFSHAN